MRDVYLFTIMMTTSDVNLNVLIRDVGTMILSYVKTSTEKTRTDGMHTLMKRTLIILWYTRQPFVSEIKSVSDRWGCMIDPARMDKMTCDNQAHGWLKSIFHSPIHGRGGDEDLLPQYSNRCLQVLTLQHIKQLNAPKIRHATSQIAYTTMIKGIREGIHNRFSTALRCANLWGRIEDVEIKIIVHSPIVCLKLIFIQICTWVEFEIRKRQWSLVHMLLTVLLFIMLHHQIPVVQWMEYYSNRRNYKRQ